jgi:hypothetical protein
MKLIVKVRDLYRGHGALHPFGCAYEAIADGFQTSAASKSDLQAALRSNLVQQGATYAEANKRANATIKAVPAKYGDYSVEL